TLSQGFNPQPTAANPFVPPKPPSPPATPPSFFPPIPSIQPYPHPPSYLWYSLRAIHIMIISRAYIASAIVGAWLTLVLAGCWHPERSWIDRFGRSLGAGWLVVSLGYQSAALWMP